MLLRGFQTQLATRILKPSREAPLIQVLIGPRQVGKTTAIKNILTLNPREPIHYFSADEALAHPTEWIRDKWSIAESRNPHSILIIDEIQKVSDWSSIVKELWDKQSMRTDDPKQKLRLVLLGSSSLEIQTGLKESLTGRFELIRAHHWDFAESRTEFGLSLDEFLEYGGYPGSYSLREDFDRWSHFIRDSIIETVIGKDLLSLRSVQKPALFRQSFELLCRYPAQEISYTKLLGQLQERGNVEVVKHYISLFEGAFLFRALEKYSSKPIKSKASSPKILPLCPALYSLALGPGAAKDTEEKGRLFEVAVGSVLNRLPGELRYWREGDSEVDFVYSYGKQVTGIEVKSGRRKRSQGLDVFHKKFPHAQRALLGQEEFLEFTQDPKGWIERRAY